MLALELATEEPTCFTGRLKACGEAEQSPATWYGNIDGCDGGPENVLEWASGGIEWIF